MIRRIVFAVALLAATVAVADACQVRTVPVQPQILLPSYSGVYTGQPQQQMDADVLRAILDELRAIREQLGNPGPAGLTLESVAAADCARCHGAKVAEKSGGGFVLVGEDGKLAALSLADKKILALRVNSQDPKQKMPPDRPLSALKLKAVVDGLK